jgi:hypothetical protein
MHTAGGLTPDALAVAEAKDGAERLFSDVLAGTGARSLSVGVVVGLAVCALPEVVTEDILQVEQGPRALTRAGPASVASALEGLLACALKLANERALGREEAELNVQPSRGFDGLAGGGRERCGRRRG